MAVDTMQIGETKKYKSLNKSENLYKAIDNYYQAIELNKVVNNLSKFQFAYGGLENSYKELGDFKKAYEYTKLMNKIYDSINSSENKNKIIELEKKKYLETSELKLKNEQERNANKNNLLFALGIYVLGLSIGMIAFVKNVKKIQKLLHNVLPPTIAKRLQKKEHPIADHFEEASVVFIDIVGFTKASAQKQPKKVAEDLNVIYTILDKIAKKWGLEKIKTIGDCYMAASGIPLADPQNAEKAANFANEAMQKLKNYDTGDGSIIRFRCGVDCGSVVAGVIGEHK
ncbi:MAG: hypothetical protein NTW25_01890, partial [Candidatus Kapabacteria bacterium]|nr:hypothetical protein [Candidatus Kapabacteria bacterium]